MAVANEVGFPVILKPTSGGGGMGMVVCSNESELNVNFQTTKDRAKVNIVRYLLSLPNIFPQILFGNDGVLWRNISKQLDISRFRCIML